jgi:protein-tyrosine phosphatase
MTFIHFPIPDRDVPSSSLDALAVARGLADRMAEGKAVAVHCRQGVGRSALLAACVLACLGEAPEAALERIAQARGCPVPDTPEQPAWVLRFGPRARIREQQEQP